MAAQLATPFETAPEPDAVSGTALAAVPLVYGDFAAHMQRLQATTATNANAMATPVLAQAWADSVLAYWQSGVASGCIDAGKPLYLVDLAPDQGQLAWSFLGALRTRLARLHLDWQVRFMACCATTEAATELLAHPYLAEYVRDGLLDAALFDVGGHGSLSLQRQGISLLHTENPLVILGLGYFQTLPSGLFATNYGKLLRASLAVTESADAAAALELRYQWSAVEATENATGQPDAVTDYYLKHFHNAAVLLPTVAEEALQRLQHVSSGRYLLLAADPGVCDAQAVRLGALMPPARWDEHNTRLPVNFHALGLIQHLAGAAVWQHQINDDGIVMHAAWRADDAGVDEHCFNNITCRLDDGHPAHALALREFIRAANAEGATPPEPASILVLLRQSQYDPAFLKQALPGLLARPRALADCARREWQNALTRTWHNFMPLKHCDGFHYETALFAMQIGYWGLARDCLQLGLDWYGEDAHELYLLAWCEAVAGASDSAMTRVRRALAIAPDHVAAQRLHEELTSKLERWQRCEWYLPQLARDAELSIEPLGQEHAESFLYPYRDEQIAVMTRLPALNSVEDARAWIAEQDREKGRRSYAVMHACWGLVGVVSCQCAQSAGYFYFWTGSDYQRSGFGQRAAKLLFSQLAATGVVEIYTSVNKENAHSQHLMQKLDFVRMDIETVAPDDAQYFYYRGERAEVADVRSELIKLCDAMDCPMRLA